MNAEAVIAALPDAALLTDKIGTITSANAAAASILQGEVRGLSLKAMIRNPAFAQALDQIAVDGQPISVDVEFRSRPPRLLSAHLARVGDGKDLLVLLRDLTREQAVEKMRSDFVANASHEMRTPLSAIIGSIETLQGPARNDPKAQGKFLATMLTQAQRMKRLIDDLLTLSRIELNEHLQPRARVDLQDIAKQAAGNLNALASVERLKIDITSCNPALVAGEADELLQVAQNLIENAIKYASGGGKIEITTTSNGTMGTLCVRDYGPGIADIHLPRLTERFYRVSTQESRARGGTGLGLAIVKHIVLRHRGKLDVSSTIGQGSTFSVHIPLYNS